MRPAAVRHKHVRLNQEKLDRVKSALGSATETEAIERAMDFVLAEQEILKVHRRVRARGRIKRLFS